MSPDFPYTAADLLGEITGGLPGSDVEDGEEGVVFSNVIDIEGPASVVRVDATRYAVEDSGDGQMETITGTMSTFVAAFVDRPHAGHSLFDAAEVAATALAEEYAGIVEWRGDHGTVSGPAQIVIRTAYGPVAVVIGFLDDPA